MRRRGTAAAVVLLLALVAVGCAPADPPAPDVVEVAAAVSDARALPPLPAAPGASAVPMYASSIAPIDAALAERMSASWRPGCPVPLEDLRYVTVTHVDFDGAVRTGELVVHADVAEGVTRVFAELFELRYPIRSMRLVDDFGADDTASMYADNTSAFNCRAITGGTAWSEHAYGRAIDVNPVENPYVVGGRVAPRTGRVFASRPDEPGVIHAGDAVVRAFEAEGWLWGGYWVAPRPLDYQHFSPAGR